ncbi:MAG: hypothetical protein S4CHLAM2_06040 [Chlamydiales bacterium]|nr:hypothetical protein [Chlamydiales bacterium]
MASLLLERVNRFETHPLVQRAEAWGTTKKAVALLAVAGLALMILSALVLAGAAHPGSAIGVVGSALGGTIGGSFLLAAGFLITCLSVTLGCIRYQRQKARLGGSSGSSNALTPGQRAAAAAIARNRT